MQQQDLSPRALAGASVRSLDDSPLNVQSAAGGRSVAAAAVTMAQGLRAAVIVVWTRSGDTARLVSACRPGIPIVALTMSVGVCRQLVLSKGVIPVQVVRAHCKRVDELPTRAIVCVESC